MSIHKLMFYIRIFLVGVILSSCSAIQPLPTITPTPTQAPRYITVDCGGVKAIASSDLLAEPGLPITCGYLEVPEDRLNPNSRNIRIGAVVVKTRSQDPKPDPVLFLYGGPAPSIPWSGYLYGWFPNFAADRDLIFFDQRGVGVSVPSLDCPEVDTWYFPSFSMDPRSTEYREGVLAAHHACHDRLVGSGIDLSTYTTVATVADLMNLRVALGYSSWNIYSLGYGTGLALSLMQQDPEGTRSIMFDSVFPLQVDTFTETGFNAERGLNLLFKYCVEDPVCNTPYPDLKSTFYEVVDQLNAHPVTLEVTDSTGTHYNASINGDRIITIVLNMLPWVSNASGLKTNTIPRMIYQIHNQKYDVLHELIKSGGWMEGYGAGIDAEILCSDVYSYSDLEKVRSANSKIDPRLAEYFNNEAKIQFDICEIWSETSNAAVIEPDGKSSVPILVQASDLDWTTPSWMFKRFADSSTNSYYVEYKGVGPLIWRYSFFGPCSRKIMDAFLVDPFTQPDITCSQEKKNQLWDLP